MNKKILSFIFGSLLVFSLFGAIEFREVAAATFTVTQYGPGYPTYIGVKGYGDFSTGGVNNPPDDIIMRVDIVLTMATGDNYGTLTVTPPATYTLKPAGSHIVGTDYPSGFSVAGGGSPAGSALVFTPDGISPSTTNINFTFRFRIDETTSPDGQTDTWNVATAGGTYTANRTFTTKRDDSPPLITLKYTGITAPKIEANTSNDIFGKGTMNVRMYTNELIYNAPTLSIRQSGVVTPTSLTMSYQGGSLPSSNWASSTYTITNTTNDGVANVLVSVYDIAGNQADSSRIIAANLVNNSDGPTFNVDTLCNAPSLNLPLDGNVSNTSNPLKFTWNAISEQSNQHVTYTLQWAKNTSFTTDLTTLSAQCNESSKTWKNGTAIPPWLITSPSLRSYNASAIDVGTWYWRVKAMDALGNESVWSSYRSFSRTGIGSTAPSFTLRYIITPKIDYNTTPDVVGSGTMQIKIYSSDTLQAAPKVQVKPHNQSTWTTLSVTPSGQSSVYTATYSIPTSSNNNGFAQVTVQGTSLGGTTGSEIRPARWSNSRIAPNYIPQEDDSDGPSFYIDTATDAPSLYKPDNGYVIPENRNEANFTFYKISDISAERPADPGQNNCLTYHIQYSTSPTFSTNVITQLVDIDEANVTKYFCEPLKRTTTYNKWDLVWPGRPFINLRRHRSQALSNGTWYWRVWATDKLGNQSPYSETRSFLVSATVPNLFSPTDLSLLITNDPVLRWYKVPSALFYNIRLSRGDTNFLDYTLYPDKIAVNNFSNSSDWDTTNGNIMDYNVSVSTPPTPAIGRLEDGVWFWKVASSLDTNAYSETWRFTVDTTGPPAPNLITLTNGQVSQNKRPTFSWSSVSDTNDLSNPVRYYIQISGNASFPNAPGPANVSFSGTTPWPGSSTFSPSWTDKTYQRGPLTTPSFVPTQDFPETFLNEPSHAFYWRVYAVDSSGNRGTNSITRNFRVSTSPPLLWGDLPAGGNVICELPWPTACRNVNETNRDQLALGLRSPSNGFTTNTRNPSLEWRHSRCDCVVREISSYIIEYSTDITFPPDKTTDIAGVFQVLGINPDNNLLLNMGYTIQTPLYNGTYFWRVCAVDTAGNRTQFTAPWSFTVNVPDNEQPPQCSATQPCPSGYTCQAGVCVPVVMAPGDLTITVHTTTGTAISGATVTVDGTAKTTDAEGKVVFAALSGGSHTINNVTASGYNDHGTSTVTVNGATAQTITMTTPGTEGYVWGTVYFDQIGSPAPNILIDIFNQSTDVKIDSRLTNSEGKFQSSPLPSTGTYYIKIPAYEKELRDLQPTSLTTGEKIVILETKGTITGIVQDDAGQIVSSATVVLKKYPGEEFVDTKTTNSIGQFSFDALPGTYVVTISKAGYDAYTSSSFSVQSRQTVNLQTVLGNIILNSIRGTLTVSVKDDKGAVVNTATVTVRSSTGVVAKSFTTSGGTGSAQLAPGSYRVSAVASGFAESLQQTTNINSNQTSSLTITLAPATGSIRVVAKDPSGAPLSGASVYIDGALAGITDSNGELLATGLKLGTHTVRITKGGFTTVEEQVTAGETAVVVDTSLKKNNLVLFLAIGLGLLILAGALYFFKFGKKGTGPKGRPAPKGLSLPQRPGAPRLRPHRHKGGLPPSSIKVKKKNL